MEGATFTTSEGLMGRQSIFSFNREGRLPEPSHMYSRREHCSSCHTNHPLFPEASSFKKSLQEITLHCPLVPLGLGHPSSFMCQVICSHSLIFPYIYPSYFSSCPFLPSTCIFWSLKIHYQHHPLHRRFVSISSDEDQRFCFHH